MNASPLSRLALDEFTIRRTSFREGIAARRVSASQAEQGLAHWAAIARYFGADLPADLCDGGGAQMAWPEFYPAGMRIDLAMNQMAGELRRATQAAIARYQADPNPTLRPRVLALIKLDSHLHYRAALPPLSIEGPLAPELDALERKAA